jgi:predicted molibdopterin-dependent oxidoreductase YjgC
MPDWRIAAELALRMGTDFDLESVEEIQDEIARVAPAFAGLDAERLRDAGDGIVLGSSEGASASGVALHVWDADASESAVPARDAYALRLVTGRALYDGGVTVAASESLADLVPESMLFVHPQDRDRLGVADGDEVRVTTGKGSVTVAVQADAATERGTAFLGFNLANPGAADLIDVTAPVTDLRVESIR